MESQDPILEVKGLSKVYLEDVPAEVLSMLHEGVSKDDIRDRTGAVVGVRDASFSVERGEIFVIMGLSGSGKSTLARCLIRLVEPTTGEIWIEGEDVAQLNQVGMRNVRRNKIAMVFQHYGLLPHRTVLENVEYGLKTRGIKPKERHEKAMSAIEQVGLKGWEHERPGSLSGGMQQRVGIARALAHSPRILLMDEPFSGLDPLIRRNMQDEFAMLRAEEQITTIFVTHDLDEALKLGDRIAIMRDGEIVQIATPAELVTNPADDYVARFVEGASPARYMTALQLMDKDTVTIKQDATLRQATDIFREHNANSAYVVDPQKRLKGVLNWWELARATDGRTIADLLRPAAKTRPSVRLETILPMATQVDHPVAVVDEQNRLLGKITRMELLQTLALDLEEDGNDENGSEPTPNGNSTAESIKSEVERQRQTIGD